MSLYMHYKYIYVNINYNIRRYVDRGAMEVPWKGGQKAHLKAFWRQCPNALRARGYFLTL